MGFAAPAVLVGKGKNGSKTYTTEILTWRLSQAGISLSVNPLKPAEDLGEGLLTPMTKGRAVWSSRSI